MLLITAISASLLAFLYVKLSLRVVALRRSLKVSVGDGGNATLLHAIRSQANLTEYAPLALILLACLELNAAPWPVTGLLACAIVAGRFLHQLGLRDENAPLKLRVLGMQLTLYGLMALALGNLVMVAYRLLAAG